MNRKKKETEQVRATVTKDIADKVAHFQAKYLIPNRTEAVAKLVLLGLKADEESEIHA